MGTSASGRPKERISSLTAFISAAWAWAFWRTTTPSSADGTSLDGRRFVVRTLSSSEPPIHPLRPAITDFISKG